MARPGGGGAAGGEGAVEQLALAIGRWANPAQRRATADITERVCMLRRFAYICTESGSQPECARVGAQVRDKVLELLRSGPTRAEAVAAGAAVCAVHAWMADAALGGVHQAVAALVREAGSAPRTVDVQAAACDAAACIHDSIRERGLHGTQLAITAAAALVASLPNIERLPDAQAAREAVAAAMVSALRSVAGYAKPGAPVLEEAKVIRQVARACRDQAAPVRVHGVRAVPPAAGCCDAYSQDQLLSMAMKGLEDSDHRVRAAAVDSVAETLWWLVDQAQAQGADQQAPAAAAPAAGGALAMLGLSRVTEAFGGRRRRPVVDLFSAAANLRDTFRTYVLQGKAEGQAATAGALCRLLVLSRARGTPCATGGAVQQPPDAAVAVALLCSLLDGVPAPTPVAPAAWGDPQLVASEVPSPPASPPVAAPAGPAVCTPAVRAVAAALAAWAEGGGGGAAAPQLARELAAAVALRSDPQARGGGALPPPPAAALACLAALGPILRAAGGAPGLGGDCAWLTDKLITAATAAECQWQLGTPAAGSALLELLDGAGDSQRHSVAARLVATLVQLSGNAFCGPGKPCDHGALRGSEGAAVLLCACVAAGAAGAGEGCGGVLPEGALSSLEVMCASCALPQGAEESAASSAQDTVPVDALQRLRVQCMLQGALAGAAAPSDPQVFTQLAQRISAIVGEPMPVPGTVAKVSAVALRAARRRVCAVQSVVFALRSWTAVLARGHDLARPADLGGLMSAIEAAFDALWSRDLPAGDEELEGALTQARALCCEAAALLTRAAPPRGQPRAANSLWVTGAKSCVASIAADWAPAAIAADLLAPTRPGAADAAYPGARPADWHQLCRRPPEHGPQPAGESLADAAADALSLLYARQSGPNQRAVMRRLRELLEKMPAQGPRSAQAAAALEQNLVVSAALCLGWGQPRPAPAAPPDEALADAAALAEQGLASAGAVTRQAAAELLGLVAALSRREVMAADRRLPAIVASDTCPRGAAAAAVAAVYARDPARRGDTVLLAVTYLRRLLDRAAERGATADIDAAPEVLRAAAAVAAAALPPGGAAGGEAAAGAVRVLLELGASAVAQGRASHAEAAAEGAGLVQALSPHLGCGGRAGLVCAAFMLDEALRHPEQETRRRGRLAAAACTRADAARQGLPPRVGCAALLTEVAVEAAADPPPRATHVAALCAVAAAACAAAPGDAAEALSPQALLRLADAAAAAGPGAVEDAATAVRMLLGDCCGEGREPNVARVEEWLAVCCDVVTATGREAADADAPASRRRPGRALSAHGKSAALAAMRRLLARLGATPGGARLLAPKPGSCGGGLLDKVVRALAAASDTETAPERVAAAALRAAAALVALCAAEEDPGFDASCFDPGADPLLRQSALLAPAAVTLAAAARQGLVTHAPAGVAAAAAELGEALLLSRVLEPASAGRLFGAVAEACAAAPGACGDSLLHCACAVVGQARAAQKERGDVSDPVSLPGAVLRRVSPPAGVAPEGSAALDWGAVCAQAADEVRGWAAEEAAAEGWVPRRSGSSSTPPPPPPTAPPPPPRSGCPAAASPLVAAAAECDAVLAVGCAALLLQRSAEDAPLAPQVWDAVGAALAALGAEQVAASVKAAACLSTLGSQLAEAAAAPSRPVGDRCRACTMLSAALRTAAGAAPVEDVLLGASRAAAAACTLLRDAGADGGEPLRAALALLRAAAAASDKQWPRYLEVITAALPAPEACTEAAVVRGPLPECARGAGAELCTALCCAAESEAAAGDAFWQASLVVSAELMPQSASAQRLRWLVCSACARNAEGACSGAAAAVAVGPRAASVAAAAGAAAVAAHGAGGGAGAAQQTALLYSALSALLGFAAAGAEADPLPAPQCALAAGVASLSCAAAKRAASGGAAAMRRCLLRLTQEHAQVFRAVVARLPQPAQQQLRAQLEQAVAETAAGAPAAAGQRRGPAAPISLISSAAYSAQR